MHTPAHLVTITALTFVLAGSSAGQGPAPFDINAYKSFLSANKDMSADQLLSLHPAGTFVRRATVEPTSSMYFRQIDSAFQLTAAEKALWNENGFVVSERIRPGSFMKAFVVGYAADLPVFISTDAILFAFHKSYDAMLKSAEYSVVIPALDQILTGLSSSMPSLISRYQSQPGMTDALMDVDLYVTVAGNLEGLNLSSAYPGNASAVDDLLKKVEAQRIVVGSAPLFGDSIRLMDYSQFTVRGHYTESAVLARYFKSMMWLGRVEFYLAAPHNTAEQYGDAAIQRQTVAALLLQELIGLAGVASTVEHMDAVLQAFVGESDNVTLECIHDLRTMLSIVRADELLATQRWKEFQTSLLQQAWAYQRINSQILISGSLAADDQLQPASSFLFMGQRFIIDSYVTANTVFDKIVYKGEKIWRALPSTLDILAALGNNAAFQLLQPELDQYHYGSNLAALRYLVDSYEDAFWRMSIYTGWLDAIRALNPPVDRSAMPLFMQTASWWQEKLNTQLASWAELRHDNLLYAKSSYTGGTTCSFPMGYVEPVPAFYDRLKLLMGDVAAKLSNVGALDGWSAAYLSGMAASLDTLGSIARKELARERLDPGQESFLQRTISSGGLAGCGAESANTFRGGWYPKMFLTTADSTMKEDYVVADVHTAPTDAAGNMVGWVLHGGTGPVDLAFVTADVPGDGLVSFVGPVLGYYEIVTENFKRLTDGEWSTQYALSPAYRPSFVNAYLADASGRRRSAGPMLITGAEDDRGAVTFPQALTLGQNYPNPFNPATLISLTVPGGMPQFVDLAVYNIQGQVVRQVVKGPMQGGHFALRWDGKNERGDPVASGVYISVLKAKGGMQSRKMVLIH